MFKNVKDFKTTIPGLLIGIPLLLQGMGVTEVGHVGNLEGGWLGLVAGIGSILLGAFSNSKGETPQ
jgi:hypothetical protein